MRGWIVIHKLAQLVLKRYFFITDQKGAVLVIAAISLFVLLGITALCADAGMLYKVRREMVTAADAGALAGAKELQLSGGSDTTEAINIAKSYAISNKADSETIVNITGSVSDGTQRIEVIAHQKVDLFFAKLLGFSSRDVTARAVATWSYLTQASGDIIPLWYYEDDFIKDQDKIILHLNIDNPANYGSFPFKLPMRKDMLSGKNVVLDNPIIAYDPPVEYPEAAATGHEAVLGSCVDDWLKAHHDDPDSVDLIGLIPIINKTRPQGNKIYFEIVCFAYFEIQDVIVDTHGNGSHYATIGSPPNYYPDLDGSKYKASIIGRFVKDAAGKPIVTQTAYSQTSDIKDAVKFARLVE